VNYFEQQFENKLRRAEESFKNRVVVKT